MGEADVDLLQFATAADADLCTHSRATFWRWRTGRARVPLAARNLLRILVAGELPQGGAPWRGWRFVRGALVDPAGYAHTPGTIESWWWTAQRLQNFRREENERLHALPPNVLLHPSARPAHALTDELYRRLEGGR